MSDHLLPVVSSAGSAGVTPEILKASFGLLEHIPYPIMWIAADYRVLWTNAAARASYDQRPTRCHAMSHSYEEPCDRHGEPCPKLAAEAENRAVSVNHAHTTKQGTELFKVTAMPIIGGGVLEFHVPLDDVMARDKLTGLHTREFFERLVQRQLALLHRIGKPYSIAMLDLDNFKRLNDEYGHAVGDEALRKVGATILKSIRDADTAGRWGGEEFCICLPATTRMGGAEQCERLLREIRAIRLSVDQPLSASAGIAQARADETFESACGRADKALYRAKSGGRDRVAASGEK